MVAPVRFVVLTLALVACGETAPEEPAPSEPLTPVVPEAEAEAAAEAAPVLEAAAPSATPEEAEPKPAGLPTKMGRRVSNQLRQLVGARVALPQVLNEELEDGGNRVMGVMSFSRQEACVGGYEDRAEGLAACHLEGDCIQYATVVAEFAAPRPNVPEGHGGSLTIRSPQTTEDLDLVCAESIEVQELAVRDIDRDGKPELIYDAIFRSDHYELRGGGTFTLAQRVLRVIRMDGTTQLSLPLSEWGGDSEATETQFARRARFEPRGGSTSPALILESVEYESIGGDGCPGDDAFFASNYQNEDEDICVGELETNIQRYDAECDCWRAENAVPENAAPEDAVPENAAPEDAVPEDADPSAEESPEAEPATTAPAPREAATNE